MLEFSVILLNVSFDMGVVRTDRRGACIYKGKDDKYAYSNSRDVSLLSVVVIWTVLSKRDRAGAECAIGEEQCGFRQGRG